MRNSASLSTDPELDPDADARDLADCRPSSVVSAAAGAAAFSGVGCLMLALQSVLLLGPSRTKLASVAFTLVALLGFAMLFMATRLLKMQLWPAIASAALSVFTAVLILAWSLFALSRGLFSMLGFAVPGLCMIAGLLSLLAIGPCQRAVAARARLRERGVNLGF